MEWPHAKSFDKTEEGFHTSHVTLNNALFEESAAEATQEIYFISFTVCTWPLCLYHFTEEK
jgi:hypothetical protein